MTRCIDEIQLVQLPVFCMVTHPHRIQLDRNAALAFQIHRVEDLLAHEPLVERPGELDKSVGKRRFAVVDVGDNAEITDMILAHRAEI